MSLEEIESDPEDLLYNKVLTDNDNIVNSNMSKDNDKSITVPSIENDLKSTQTGKNKADIDEYEYDSSDEEVCFFYFFLFLKFI